MPAHSTFVWKLRQQSMTREIKYAALIAFLIGTASAIAEDTASEVPDPDLAGPLDQSVPVADEPIEPEAVADSEETLLRELPVIASSFRKDR